jgi:hypothetical protein
VSRFSVLATLRSMISVHLPGYRLPFKRPPRDTRTPRQRLLFRAWDRSPNVAGWWMRSRICRTLALNVVRLASGLKDGHKRLQSDRGSARRASRWRGSFAQSCTAFGVRANRSVGQHSQRAPDLRGPAKSLTLSCSDTSATAQARMMSCPPGRGACKLRGWPLGRTYPV